MSTQSAKANAGHALHVQIEAARVLLANYRDVLGDDDIARADAIEGETSLKEAIVQGIARIAELEAMETGAETMLANLKARCARLATQKENLRTSLAVALEIAGEKKVETALGTISLKNVPPKCEITDESSIPAKFWKPQEPRLDKKAVLDALKAKEDVPGAVLGNGGATIQLVYR